MVRFAVSLGKTTTAEGVETREQLDILRADSCVEVQGFHFSPPVQSEKVAQMIGGRAVAAAERPVVRLAMAGAAS
ncbi:EAL domain-containing protein [Bradyrhizobium sp. SK17]|uniref:EAL domain-containing protein n=1 Tax=Bradyrhizobium sp. SK17 TaxID=2057741 RepID=UPI00352F1624